MIQPPCYPIVYVRGYAGRQGEVEDTVATPYMGFNLGSTKLRQEVTGRIETHVFESPLLRFLKDHGYVDAYRDGEILPRGPVAPRSVWIFRYYDVTSEDLGEGRRLEIEEHAENLRRFLRHVREAVLEEGEDPAAFRAHLVAHSMGGLVCRAYLQNRRIPGLDGAPAASWEQKGVAKLFTYATPHGGIEFRQGLGWVEGLRDFLDANNAGNFGPKRMREFLDLEGSPEPVSSLAGRFPVERVFSLVGTNGTDYGAVFGLSKRSVGPMSDGLVKIENAVVQGSARAFVHRSHSGHYGIVNSESGYQNLVRFLFGDVKIDAVLEVAELTLPAKVQRKKDDEDAEIRASYHFEAIARVRGARWDLSRRLVEDGSAVFRTYDELLKPGPKGPRHPHLATLFLSGGERVTKTRRSLGFSLDVRVQVPDYYVGKRFWRDEHHEGGFLFRDKLNFEATPPGGDGGDWTLKVGFDSRTPNRATMRVDGAREDGALVFRVPLEQRTKPGFVGTLVLTCRRWEI